MLVMRKGMSRSCSAGIGDSLGDSGRMVVCEGTLVMIWGGSWGRIEKG